MRIDLHTLETFRDKNQVKSLALAFAIKTRYTNSILYNWSYVKLAEQFGIDRRTAKKYITNLFDENLVEQQGKDLKVKKLFAPRNYHIGINRNYLQGKSLIDISKFLYGLLLKQNLRTQRNACITKRESLTVNQCKTLARFKHLKHTARRMGLNIRDYLDLTPDELAIKADTLLPNYEFYLSIPRICGLFNTSAHKVRQVTKMLQNEDILTVKRNTKYLGKAVGKHVIEFYKRSPRHYVTKHGGVVSLKAHSYWWKGI